MDKENTTFDVRFYLKDEFARVARDRELLSAKPDLEKLSTYNVAFLFAVLEANAMSLHCQLDEFQEYVDKQNAITDWDEAYPDENERKFHQQLLAMTEKTLADPAKCEYLAREFTVERPGGNPEFQGAFKGDEANKIIKDLQALDKLGIYGKGPRPTQQGVRKVFAPPRHPGTTVPHPGAHK